MPIGITYNAGDLILQSVSSSGNTFQENKIAAATSSIILFNSSGNLTSQSLNATTVGTSSYLSGSKIIVSDITASNISASGYISASTFVGTLTGSNFGTSSWSTNSLTASSLVSANSYTITNLTASNISAIGTGSFGMVGIGLAAPADKLHINAGDLRIGQSNSLTESITNNINFVNTNVTNSPIAVISVRTGAATSNSNLIFQTAAEGTPSEKMRIAGDGNVGIGTTRPVNRLDVAGNISCSVITASLFNGTSSWSTNALTASSLVAANSYTITNLTSSNISASGNITATSFSGSNFGTSSWSTNSLTASSLVAASSYTITNLTASNISASATGSFGIVGIGTTSPTARLHVNIDSPNGQIRETIVVDGQTQSRTASGSGQVIAFKGTGGYFGGVGGFGNGILAGVGLWGGTVSITGSNPQLFVASSGNVGIGTTSPGEKLNISGGSIRFDGTNNYVYLQNGNSDSSPFLASVANVLATANYGWGFFDRGTEGNFQLQYRAGSTSWNPAITVLRTTGNVGIGTTSPAYLLDVSGSSRFGYRSADTHQFTGSVGISGSLNATSSWSTNALTASYVASSNVVGTVTSASYALSASSAPTTITASWATNALTASSLVVGNSYNITNLTASNISASRTGSFGMVGIGTTSPAAKLDIVHDSTATTPTIYVKGGYTGVAIARFERIYGATASIDINANSGNPQLSIVSQNKTFAIGTNNISSSFEIADNATIGTNTRFLIDANGNVGIGTTSPGDVLHISSNGGVGFRIQDSTGSNGGDTRITQVGQKLSINTYQTGHSFTGTPFVIDGATQNVGIGTTSPAYLLDVSGSSRFGFTSTNTHQFTGSVSISGSLNATSSWSTNALTASYVSSSNIVGTVTSASYALSASSAPTTITASWATNALTASSLVAANSYTITNLTASNIGVSNAIINGNLTVTGSIFASLFSASNIYITSSTLTVTDNIITINALNPYQRYAGLEMYDSGSGTLSSFLWDSLNNYFFISSSDAGASRRVILGPIGEASLTANYIPLISGSNNITSSVIYQSSGLIGIGLINPVNRLDVAGNISCSAITASFFGTSSWSTNSLTASSLVTSNSYTITNLTSSNISASGTGSFGIVGIGTTAPAYNLQILGLGTIASPTTLAINATNYQTSGDSRIILSQDTSIGDFQLLYAGTDISRSDGRTANNAYIEQNQGISIRTKTNGSTLFNAEILVGLPDNIGAITFSTNVTNSASIERVRIDTSGKVGIGTTSPVNKLDVAGNISCSAITASFFGTSSWATNALTASYVTSSNVIGTVTSASYALSASFAPTTITASWSTNALTASSLVVGNSYNITNLTASNISASGTGSFGMVGIGTTSPAYLLDVSGSSRHGYRSADTHQFTGSVSISGSLNATSSWATNSLTASSLVAANSYTINVLTSSNQIIYKNAVLLDYSSSTLVTSQSNYVVLQNLTGSYNSAFFDYFASSASNFRAGTMIAGWSGSGITYTEYSTTDIGNTNQLTMSVAISASYIQLLSNASSSLNWNVKSSGRYL